MSPEFALTPHASSVLSALQMLVEGRLFAESLRCSPWDFAVTLQEMRDVGCTINGLRYLVRSAHVDAAIELPDGRKRQFKKPKVITFQRRTCFILTDSGRDFAIEAGITCWDQPRRPKATETPQPMFISRELRVGNRIIKRFRQPAENQELILMAFEELAWQPRIDDPLPPIAEVDPKLRLRQTIANLNRNHQIRLVHFIGNGTGKEVGWEWVA